MIQNLINHVIFDIDKSGSMNGQPVVKVFDTQLEYLKRRSVELNQETRISVNLFDNDREVLIYDMDVMRFRTLAGHYRLGSSTALIDAVLESISDHKKIPVDYGDHAFLHYVITDGGENASYKKAGDIVATIGNLSDNWTHAILVPNAVGVAEAKRFGFPSGAIDKWDISSATGLEDAGRRVATTIDSYMDMRSRGIRGSRSGLFTLGTKAIKVSKLTEINPRNLTVISVRAYAPIKELVEGKLGHYTLGSAYYEPTKKVKVQDHKDVIVQNIHSGKYYTGDNLRDMLGLPDHTVEVTPTDHKDWKVFIQSTSVNRKVIAGTTLLVKK